MAKIRSKLACIKRLIARHTIRYRYRENRTMSKFNFVKVYQMSGVVKKITIGAKSRKIRSRTDCQINGFDCSCCNRNRLSGNLFARSTKGRVTQEKINPGYKKSNFKSSRSNFPANQSQTGLENFFISLSAFQTFRIFFWRIQTRAREIHYIYSRHPRYSEFL